MEQIDEPLANQRLALRLERWSGSLRRLHLDGLVGALLDAGEPLGPLGAHLLWVAQPTLALFVPRDDVAALARLLEQPEGLAQVRRRLIGPDDDES